MAHANGITDEHTTTKTRKTKPGNTEGYVGVTIKPPNFTVLEVRLMGTAPYVQHKFSAKQQQIMRAKQEAGTTASSKKVREPKDFEAAYKDAMYISVQGWPGIPASSFRKAAISACRLVGFKMTLAKLAIFVEADGFDATDGTPLVRIEGTPQMDVREARLPNGSPDLRVRPMFKTWSARLRVRFDADVFTGADLMNLLARVGQQVGIGEGRPDSKNSAGIGWGTFELAETAEIRRQ